MLGLFCLSLSPSQEGVEVRVARIFNTFGSRMHMNDGRVVSNFILQALQGEPLTVRVTRFLPPFSRRRLHQRALRRTGLTTGIVYIYRCTSNLCIDLNVTRCCNPHLRALVFDFNAS